MRIRKMRLILLTCGCIGVMMVYHILNMDTGYKNLIQSTLVTIDTQKIIYPTEDYFIIPNLIISSTHNIHENSKIVICVQTTLNNLYQITDLSRKWDGQISLAVYTMTDEIRFIVHYILLLRSCIEDVRLKVTFHLVYPISKPPVNLGSIYDMDFGCHTLPILQTKYARENFVPNIPYPQGLLRNVALVYSTSTYVLNLDIDFEPSKRMAKEMETFLERRTSIEKQKRLAYVIPCFESNITIEHPLSKTELLAAFKKRTVRQFTLMKCKKCHIATNYTRWMSLPYPSEMNASYFVNMTISYEPFYVADRQRIPQFDAIFKQYGVDRVSQVCEAYYSGYDFTVMNNAFVVHKGFKDPQKFYRWKNESNEMNKIIYKRVFKPRLILKYPKSKRNCP